MAELIEANWIWLIIALVIGILVAWWVFVSSRRTKVEVEPQDEETGPARSRRNQALIDAPPAAPRAPPAPAAAAREVEGAERVMPPAAPAGLAGAGEAVQSAAEPVPEPETAREADTKREAEPARARESGADREPDLTGGAAMPAPSPEEAAKPAPAPAESAPVQPAPTHSAPTQPAPAQPAPAEPAGEAQAGDDLTRIKGLGPKLQARLHELGVTGFAQIAAWDEAEIDRIDSQLDRFQGRIRRDNWPEQARLLAAGDTAGYEDRFGKL